MTSDKQRDNYLRRKYGISLEQYNDLLRKQNGCCAICERHHSTFTTRLAVDHNHITGEVRGLLCYYDNRFTVGRHRDANVLRKVAEYIEQGTGWYVPKKKRTVKRKPNG